MRITDVTRGGWVSGSRAGSHHSGGAFAPENILGGAKALDRPWIDLESTLDRPWIDPESTLDRPQIDPGSTLDGPWIDPFRAMGVV